MGQKVKNIKEKCDMILEALVGINAMDIWWNSPNRAFDMRPPKEMFLPDFFSRAGRVEIGFVRGFNWLSVKGIVPPL